MYIKKQLGSLAVPHLQRAIDARPAEPVFYYHLGLAYAQTGNKAAARQALERALGLKGDFGGADDARKLLKTID